LLPDRALPFARRNPITRAAREKQIGPASPPRLGDAKRRQPDGRQRFINPPSTHNELFSTSNRINPILKIVAGRGQFSIFDGV
jgi:hypothetical protein